MRSLRFNNKNSVFKFADTTTDIKLIAEDDEQTTSFKPTDFIKVKVRNKDNYLLSLRPDLSYDTSELTFNSEKLKALPPDSYQIELWVNNKAIYPSSGFLNFTVTHNINDDNGTASTITLDDFEARFNDIEDKANAVIAEISRKSVPLLPILKLTGNYEDMTKDNSVVMGFELINGDQNITGFTKSHWQGDSSQAYPKKNLTLKLYKDEDLDKKLKFKPKATWKKNNKFNLKANWIDRVEARNLVNAKLVEETATSRPLYYGNENFLPNKLANFSLNGDYNKFKIMQYAPKEVLGADLTCSFDVKLLEDAGKDEAGNSLNKAAMWFNNQNDSRITSQVIDMTDVSVGSIKHFSVKVSTDNAHYVGAMVFNSQGNVTPASNGKGRFQFSNISLYQADAEPKDYEYHPSLFDMRDAYNQSPYYGQVQGMPVEVYINNVDQGLYTLNTKKNEELMGMDEDDPDNIIISVGSGKNIFGSEYLESKFDGSDLEIEVGADQEHAEEAFKRLQKFSATATNDEFRENIAKYVDVYSVIDTYLLTLLMNNIDGGTKSILWSTYDGIHWIAVPYDLDSTWQLYWNGSVITSPWTSASSVNWLENRLTNLFSDLVISRYSKLRNNILSGRNISDEFEKFIEQIPWVVYQNNEDIWPNIPSIELTSFSQIKKAIATLSATTDNQLSKIIGASDDVDTSLNK